MSPSSAGPSERDFGIRPSIVLLTAAALSLAIIIAAPDLVAPHDPYDLGTIELANAHRPPMVYTAGSATFPLGTDEQGRDLLSLVVFGTRTSLLVATISTALAATVGTALGLTAAVTGRTSDVFIKRLAELQLTYPALLVALLLEAALRVTSVEPDNLAPAATIVIAAVALSSWPEFALCARAIARSQLALDYIAAAVSIGQSRTGVVRLHLWPAVRGQVLVLALWAGVRAITLEATLSFLGSGLPPTVPSLGRLIRDGQSALLDGEWWIAGIPLVTITALIALLGAIAEHIRHRTDPRLSPHT